MKVLKFGGSSLASSTTIKKVISIIIENSQTAQIICVFSAIANTTDKLISIGNTASNKDLNYVKDFDNLVLCHTNIINEIINSDDILSEFLLIKDRLKKLLDGIYLANDLSPKILDKLLSYGELFSLFIISKALKNSKITFKTVSAHDLIVSNSDFNNAKVYIEETNSNVVETLKNNNNQVTITSGFIAKSKDNEFTTLGRGGSDYSAAIIAAATQSETLEIWTDVSGMYTTNPKLVKQAFPIKTLSYQEAMELSHFGAKVLYPPSIKPVLELDIPIKIKNTLKPQDEGTIISSKYSAKPPLIKGISNINNISLLTLEGNGMVGVPGFSKRLFGSLADHNINIILITQASSEHSICFAVNCNDAEKSKKVIDTAFKYDILQKKLKPLIIENNLSIIALVGDNMKNNIGLSGKMFSTLGKNNINIRAIAQGSSEKNISVVLTEKDVKKALNCLHERFFEVQSQRLNLFIIGTGNVGKHLIKQIETQHEYLLKNLQLNLKIIGLSNSKKMIFNEYGIDISNWEKALSYGKESSVLEFYKITKKLNLANSIFIDVTASKEVTKNYADYLKDKIAVIACNKIACSNGMESYNRLKNYSIKYNTPFLFETNVGAGLPILNTLNNLIASGDNITEIQGVLSGSLNYIFNSYNGGNSFNEVVKQAQKNGYTEPDPRIDLSGIDVARKILILARESGYNLDLSDIEITNILTQNNISSNTISSFYDSLNKDESHFKMMIKNATDNGSKLKYVAELKNGKAKVGLKQIPKDHPFYSVDGKDNIVMFYTNRYKEQPLIIKGAGAGADVTASGVFSDIIKLRQR